MNPFLALNMPGGMEMFILFILVLVLFGAKKLPELARGLGQAFNEFRKAKDDFNRELESAAPNTVQVQQNPDKQPYAAAPVSAPAPASAPVPAPAPQPPANSAH